MPRIKYPNRTVYFGVQTGLVDEKTHAEKVEHDRLLRLTGYVDNTACMLQVIPIEAFKKEFGL